MPTEASPDRSLQSPYNHSLINAMSKEKHFTPAMRCDHCHNLAPMEIVFTHSQVRDYEDSDTYWEAGPVYQLNECPACHGVILRHHDFHSGFMDGNDIEYTTLYPTAEKELRGLPPKIASGYKAALKVRNIDPNAYAVLIGRVLDMVTEDRGASGDTLDEKLKNLAKMGEIPSNLVDVAAGLRKLRNVGAHADLGELTVAELPVLDDLARAILEYVYSAPLLAREAQVRLANLQKHKFGKR